MPVEKITGQIKDLVKKQDRTIYALDEPLFSTEPSRVSLGRIKALRVRLMKKEKASPPCEPHARLQEGEASMDDARSYVKGEK
ncbi:MAG: hypothetical protein CSA34_00720 [Desulfobulbus propionicus]|nr:MAG: hypothetical protein CSA34_00720 [Desulfobulbus propionicus]